MHFSGVKYLTLLALVCQRMEKLVEAEFQLAEWRNTSADNYSDRIGVLLIKPDYIAST